MRVLLVLSAFLAASHAAPQFVFVLPQGFQQLGQEGAAAPEIKPLNFDFSSATAAAEAAPAQEAEVAADAAAELDAEAAGVVDPAAAAEAEVALEIPVEHVSPVVDATPAEETAPAAEEVPAEGAPAAEVAIVEEVIPSENEIIAEAVVELIEPDVAKDAPVEEQPAVAATGKSLVAAEEVPVPVKVSPSPAVNQVDPLAIVDPRYRQFIYQNDAPDVVAAKIELFRIHADRIPVSPAATVTA